MKSLVLNHPFETSAEEQPALGSARLAASILFFMKGALFATWVSRIPAMETARGMSHGVLGLALLAIALGAMVAMPFTGWLSARYGSRLIAQLTSAFTAAGLPLLVLAPNGAWLVLTLFTFGIAHGAMGVAMNAQAVTVEKHYGRPINSSFHALFSIGGLIGAVAGGVAASAGISTLTHFTVAAAVVGGLTAIVAYPRLLAPAASVEGATSETPRRSIFVKPDRALLGLGAIAFCAMVSEGAMADWSGVFLRSATHASEGWAAAGYAVFSVTMTVGRLAGDRLSASLGSVALVRLSGAMAAIGLTWALIQNHAIPALLGFAAVGLGFATVVPQVFSAASRTRGMPSEVALASVTSLGYFGFLIGPPVIGFAAEWVGIRYALGLIVLAGTLLVVMAHSVGERRREVVEREEEMCGAAV